jgi:hypothetical protein
LFDCPGSFGCSNGAAAGKGFDKGGGDKGGGEQRPKNEAGSFIHSRIEDGSGGNGWVMSASTAPSPSSTTGATLIEGWLPPCERMDDVPSAGPCTLARRVSVTSPTSSTTSCWGAAVAGAEIGCEGVCLGAEEGSDVVPGPTVSERAAMSAAVIGAC